MIARLVPALIVALSFAAAVSGEEADQEHGRQPTFGERQS